MAVRLQKLLAEAGLGSRRKCEALITEGRVTVDGLVAELGVAVDPATQVVAVDGHRVVAETKEYWLLNKPEGVLTASSDSRGRRTVVECVPAGVRVFPVGRLDLNSTGVLLLTNDGELGARLLHPRYHVDKEYVVTVLGKLSEKTLKRLRGGVELEDGMTGPADVEALEVGHLPTGAVFTVARVTIREGRNRQVRRMMEAVGHRVVALHRSRFGQLTDAGLAPGEARPLNPREIENLRRSAFAR